MGIIQWMKKLLKINEIKQIEAPKNITKDDNWKNYLHYDISDDEVFQKLTKEEKRIKQIKAIEDMVLYKKEITKRDICKKIEEKYRKSVLEDTDMQALIVLHAATKKEDEMGDTNIRYCIEDGNNNIVEIVNKLIENAKEEAKLYEDIPVSELITINEESIKKIIKEIEEKKENIGIEPE